MKLSIIIPVYNTGSYLRKCLDSIYKKNPLTANDFEVIAVNDGSTDDSQAILDDYAHRYANFKTFSQANQGQGAARNRAIEVAGGDYIYFLDSDDYIDSAALLRALKKGSDRKANLIVVDYIKVSEDGSLWYSQDKNVYKNLPEEIKAENLLCDFAVRGAICSYVYDRRFLMDKSSLFTEGIYHEDEEFIVRYIAASPSIYNSKETVYYYTQRSGSTVNPITDEKKEKLLKDLLQVGCSIADMSTHAHVAQVKRGLSRKASQIAIGYLIRLYKTKLPKRKKDELLKNFADSPLYPIKTSTLKLSHKMFAFIANPVIRLLEQAR